MTGPVYILLSPAGDVFLCNGARCIGRQFRNAPRHDPAITDYDDLKFECVDCGIPKAFSKNEVNAIPLELYPAPAFHLERD
jgi:hypothetical protein